MTLCEFDIRRFTIAKQDFLDKRRPALGLREQCDLACRLKNQTMELFEVRTLWQTPKRIDEYYLAKANYVQADQYWKIYWMDKNRQWQPYKTENRVKTIEAVFTLIDDDEYGSFFG